MKISAIVPVYNTEKYVARCIESVIAQSYEKWELILIDDGSTDKSLDILKEYEIKDARIKVIHQNNAGPGIARNTGIRSASGDYIVFIDSDDIIKPNYFKKLSQKRSDVVFIDIDQVDEKCKVFRHEYMSEYHGLSKDDFIRGQMTGKILWGGVRKAVKRRLLIDNNIYFTKHKIGEEAIYSFLLMHYANSFSFIKGVAYEYINRPDSQSSLKDDDPWGPVAIELKKVIKELGLYEKYANSLNAFIVTATIVSLDRIAAYNNFRTYKKKAIKRINRFQKEIDIKFPIDYKSMERKAKMIFPLMKTKSILPIYIISSIKTAIRLKQK